MVHPLFSLFSFGINFATGTFTIINSVMGRIQMNFGTLNLEVWNESMLVYHIGMTIGLALITFSLYPLHNYIMEMKKIKVIN